MVVLLVDDNEELRTILEMALSGLPGVEVLCANSGEGALALLESRKIDLLFTDFRMGGMSGLDLLTNIRAKRLTPMNGSVMMSGETDESLSALALAAGALEFWRKPVSPMKLRGFVLAAKRGEDE